ncbi:P-loop containing nucleoside triphosphate hydrolase protein, partial [Dothidotthia symphoricarpi CBS 119687]
WATQQVQRDFQATANKQNVPTESGIIEEIICVNFMCHEHLKVSLGPLINFIVGNNGSGKSAVLTALTICLGGKATATNRAQNLKSLIKEGKDHCTVSVRIKNQGALAYKSGDYGSSIVVERHFNRSGTSGFKLKDQNGKIFFLQGTQLETLNRDYQQIEQSLESMNTKAEFKESGLDVLRKKMEILTSKARRAENLEKMRAAETELAHQAAWAGVEQLEKEEAEMRREVQRLDALIEQRTAAVEAASVSYERADSAFQVAQEEVTELTTGMEPAQQQVKDAADQFNDVKKKLLGLMADERKSGGDVKLKQDEVARYEADIEQLRQRQAQADNGRMEEKVREVEEAKTERERAETAYSKHNEGFAELQEQLKTVQNEKIPIDKNVERARGDERRIRNNINTLQQGEGNWLNAYPNSRDLQKLLHAIDGDGRFREKPVGPMGRHVKLLLPQWGHILEKQFGGILNGFVVTSRSDQAILSGLMRKCGWTASILIGNNNRIDTTQHEPHSSLQTWLKALRIENHLVRNQFIINQGIEQTVLIEDQTEGTKFMHDRGPLTDKVKMCFTFADGDKRKGRVINYTSNGGINDSPIAEFRGLMRMQVDKEAQIREEQARHNEAQREVRELEDLARKLQEKIHVCKTQEQNHQRLKKQLDLKRQRAHDAVERLEIELSNATPDDAAIDVLQEQREVAKEELERAEGVFEDVVLQRVKLNDENRINKTNMDEAQKALDEHEYNKNKAIDLVTGAQGNQAEWKEARVAKQGEIDTMMKGAAEICPERVEIPDGKTQDQLVEKWQKLVATRKQAEDELGGSQSELLRQANGARKTHYEAMQELEHIKALRSHLINTVINRRARWKQFRSGISVRARVTFNYLLSERKFRGTLSIDHAKQALDIHVQPDIMEVSGDGRQTKTLSGGEKSFSTVCLLLSLWDAMGSPIRCLDEFDVFMDSVNRDRSMNMIIKAARRSIGRQFIFITPQSMNNVKQDSDVKIIRMRDPERGQSALNFQ